VTITKHLTSLDRQTRNFSSYREIDTRESLLALQSPGRWIARGAGVSYPALSFGEGVDTLAMGRMSRVLSFDPEARCIEVEAGTALGDVFEITAPHGLYLPVQAGHPQITVGGAIASDVHGKNPSRDGLFHNQVQSLELFHPEFGIRTVSPESQSELFELTCGGHGLTGVIVSATLRLSAMPSPRLRMRTVPVATLHETFEQILELEGTYDFLYSWNDLSRFDDRFGSGYLSVGTFDKSASGQFPVISRRFFRLNPSNDLKPRVPLLNKLSIPQIATAHCAINVAKRSYDTDLWNTLYPGARQAFYFDLYGGAGFFGHMVLIPQETWREYAADLERIMKRHGVPLVLSAIKRFDGCGRFLRFDGRGFSLHMHVPNTAGGRQLVADLERLAVEAGAIRTSYVDAHLDGEDVRRQYPEVEEFSAGLRRADPGRSFQSSFSRRLDL